MYIYIYICCITVFAAACQSCMCTDVCMCVHTLCVCVRKSACVCALTYLCTSVRTTLQIGVRVLLVSSCQSSMQWSMTQSQAMPSHAMLCHKAIRLCLAL